MDATNEIINTPTSSVRLDLVVTRLPSNRLALTNRVYLSPKNFECMNSMCSEIKSSGLQSGKKPSCHPFIAVGRYPYEVEAHPDIQDDQIALNRLQRRSSFLRLGETVSVTSFDVSNRIELDAVYFSVRFLPCRAREHRKEIDTDRLSEYLLVNYEGQFFEKYQTIAVDFEGLKLLLEVQRLVVNGAKMGRLFSRADLNFSLCYEHPNSVKLIGTKVTGGFLDLMRWKGTPRKLMDLINDCCFDAMKVHEFRLLQSRKYIGQDLLHYSLQIKAPLEVLDFLVGKFPDMVETQNTDIMTPFHMACSCGSSLEAVQFLAEKSLAPFEQESLDGNNPLHLACLAAEAPADGVLNFLFQNHHKGLAEKNAQGWTPLHCSCAQKLDIENVQTLVNEFPEALEIKDDRGRLPLHLACSNSTEYERSIVFEIVELLLDKNPSAAKEIDKYQRTPLHYACWSFAPIQVVQLLVEKYPHAVRNKDGNAQMPSETGLGVMDTEVMTLLGHVQLALDSSIAVSRVLELLTMFHGNGWRGGIGLTLDAQSSRLHHFHLDDILMPDLMVLIGRRCKLSTMMEVVKGMPGLFESIKPDYSV